MLAGEYKRVFFHVQTKRARFYLTLLALEWLGGFQVFHGGALLKASCVFTDIFATLLAEMKWAWPTTSCSAAQTHTCRQPRPKPHPYHPFSKAPIQHHPPFLPHNTPPMFAIVHARFLKKKKQTKMRENTICVCLFALVFCSGELPTFVKRAKRGSGQGAGGVTGFTDGELGHAYICKYNHYAGPFQIYSPTCHCYPNYER